MNFDMPESANGSTQWKPKAESYRPGFSRITRAAVLDE